MTERFGDYDITALPARSRNGRYSVNVRISKREEGRIRSAEYSARDGIFYILEQEAAKEAIILGRNLIARGLVFFG